MSNADPTAILRAASAGDGAAVEQLVPVVYEELRTLAAAFMQRERSDHTLNPTSLVHEAYLRLIDQHEVDWQSKAHFMAVAARMIRRILVDHARGRNAAKRGGGERAVSLEPDDTPWEIQPGVDLLALDEALESLAERSERQYRIVELRFFGGLGVEDTARILEIAPTTVKDDWRVARAWLHAKLAE